MELALTQSPRVMEPGLRLLPRGVERHTVHGGGVTAVWLQAGDRVQVIDPEGLQACEVSMFNAAGTCTPELLDSRPVSEMSGTANALSRDTTDARRVSAALREAGGTYATAKGFHLFGRESLAGASDEFTTSASGTCMVAAPGEFMRVDRELPATALTLFVYRNVIEEDAPVRLPDPLADPRIDLRINRRTAQTYEVKAGEYIQIIDVEGRECSDFQCFDQQQLDNGIERCLDATNTRYIVGAAYPAPGLFSKFYDEGLEPVLEVIRDTCGRHDSFGVACTAKYYEDMGYPGHINCSDNFQRRARTIRHRTTSRVDGDEPVLQHEHRRQQPIVFRRTLVSTGRLRLDAGDKGSGLCVVRMPL
jgi:aminomethyltransferase